MSEYDNSNRGVLFKNDRKETEKHPDYTGSLFVGDTEHWFSAWIKTSKNGKKFLSLSLGEVKGKPKPQPQNNDDDFFDAGGDQDIPFMRPHDEYFG